MMSDEQVELAVERRFDRLDARLMNGELSNAEYEQKAKVIQDWAEVQYNLPPILRPWR